MPNHGPTSLWPASAKLVHSGWVSFTVCSWYPEKAHAAPNKGIPTIVTVRPSVVAAKGRPRIHILVTFDIIQVYVPYQGVIVDPISSLLPRMVRLLVESSDVSVDQL